MSAPTTIREQVTRDEGYRPTPYFDCCGKPFRDCRCKAQGKLTVGCGRNLEDTGISLDERDLMLTHDIERATAAVLARIPHALHLDDVRRAALVNMALNIGIGGLLKFKKMLAAVEREDWPAAARELLDSTYHRQVGIRAERLAEQLVSGEWR